jgi:HD-GYP domain-containing protein (c-di-GMP phosphodiesterase class II)
MAELHRHADTQFDPELVDIFDRLYAKRPPVPDLTLLGDGAFSAVPQRYSRKRASA